MLFRKRISTEEVAEALRQLHASAFSNRALGDELKSANAVLGDEAYQKAMLEYFVFGLFVITKTMTDALQGKVVLRDEILDRFYENVYRLLSEAGLEGLEHSAFQRKVRERLAEYYAALEIAADPGPVYWLGKAVSSNVLGHGRDLAHLLFMGSVWGHLCACADFVKELLSKYRLTS